jgi:hypothetical protein
MIDGPEAALLAEKRVFASRLERGRENHLLAVFALRIARTAIGGNQSFR